MLYHLLYPLVDYHTVFNVFRYVTFRTAGAIVTSLLLSLVLGPYIIERLRALHIGQQIREDGPRTHLGKAGTPRMGGVGFCDDYLKLRRKSSKGLAPRYKFTWQIMLGLGVGLYLYLSPVDEFTTRLSIPFVKWLVPDLEWVYVLLVMLVIVGCSNAVNLTDGLDGLATGPMIMAAGPYPVLAYVAGHGAIARYLQVIYVRESSELTIFGGAVVGASLGFLWFNAYPAQIFMGDTGSLALGTALALLAVLTKHELLLMIIGGVFVIEAISVLLQVFSYKTTGRRIFRMAPIHHHYELNGVAEPKIIVRFWIISFLLALISLTTLKLR